MSTNPLDCDQGLVTRMALDAVQKAEGLTPANRQAYLEALAGVGIHAMRAVFGDDYARGWLDAAIADLDRPPLMHVRKPQ